MEREKKRKAEEEKKTKENEDDRKKFEWFKKLCSFKDVSLSSKVFNYLNKSVNY